MVEHTANGRQTVVIDTLQSFVATKVVVKFRLTIKIALKFTSSHWY